jgi:hypothetical protein
MDWLAHKENKMAGVFAETCDRTSRAVQGDVLSARNRAASVAGSALLPDKVST